MGALTFHGHACFEIAANGHRLVIDPFPTGNPAAPPIRDNFTMGMDAAVRAVDFAKPKTVIPMHYGTWDVINADPNDFATKVGSTAQVVVLRPRAYHQF